MPHSISAGGKDKKMSDEVANLMVRNIKEVFNEKDPARRIAAIKSIYAKEAELFEGDKPIKGHDAISAKVGALQASFPPDFTFSPTSEPARIHDLGRVTWRVGPTAAPPAGTGMDVALFKNGRIHSLYTFVGGPADKS